MKRAQWVWRAGLSGMLLVGLAACGDEGDDSEITPDDPQPGMMMDDPAGMTYHKDVRPLVELSCMGCHNGGGSAPAHLDFRDAETVKMLAPVIVAAVENRTMPPWQADSSDGCGDFRDDISLNQEQIDAFSDWFDDGAKIGDPADFQAMAPRPSELGIERLDGITPAISVKSLQRYAPEPSLDDDFRCFVVDPELVEDHFLYGYEVKPDNRALLHHLIVFTTPDTSETRAEIARMEAEDSDPGFPCFGDARVDDQGLAMAWAPGTDKAAFPEDTALRIPAGTLFVLQMHYNLSEGGAGDDQSSVEFFMNPSDKPPEIETENIFVGNLPFVVPAGVNGLEAEECDVIYSIGSDLIPEPKEGTNVRSIQNIEQLREVTKTGCVQQDFYYANPGELKVWSVAPHMHLQGRQISIEIMPIDITAGEEGAEVEVVTEDNRCLIDMPRWDFNWQRSYWFKEPMIAPSRGVVRLTCRYDNSRGTEEVALGDGSGAEMCLGLLTLSE